MSVLRLGVSGILVLALVVAAGAQEKDKGTKKEKPGKERPPVRGKVQVDKAKLVGTWVQAGAPKGKKGTPGRVVVDIAKDGKVTITMTAASAPGKGKDKGKKPQVETSEWTSEVKGNTITLTRKGKDKEESESRKYTVTHFSKGMLTVKDEEGQVMEFKKQGEKKKE
jgi:hypothetical protein